MNVTNMNAFARYICFTFNNPREDDINKVKDLIEEHCSYGVFGEEVGEGGTPHLQGYIELPTKPRARLSTVKRWFPRGAVHLEKRRGHGKTAAAYCKKGMQTHDEWMRDGADGLNYGLNAVVFEYGELSDLSERKRTDVDKVREGILSGKIKNEFDLLMEAPSTQSLRFGQALLNNMPVAVVRDRPLVYWIYGPTGSGKSHTCADIVQRLVDIRGWSFWRSNGTVKWFDGYNRQEVVWFDDYRFSGGPADFAYMLNLLDVYPMRVPVKGGFVTWTPRVILLTAPRGIQESFSSVSQREDIGQLERRVTRSFDFGAGQQSELSVAIWSYMQDPEKHYEPVQKWSDIDFGEHDDDEEEDPEYVMGEADDEESDGEFDLETGMMEVIPETDSDEMPAGDLGGFNDLLRAAIADSGLDVSGGGAEYKPNE